jgi:hypothetical protein
MGGGSNDMAFKNRGGLMEWFSFAGGSNDMRHRMILFLNLIMCLKTFGKLFQMNNFLF